MYEAIRKRRVKYRHYDYTIRQKDAEDKKLPQSEWGWREGYGWFAGYGLDVIDGGENGVASYTVGIVEDDDDGIKLIHVSHIKFIP